MRIEMKSDGTLSEILKETRDRGEKPVVTLNGKCLRYVIIADTNLGYVKHVPEDESAERRGRPLFDFDVGKYIVRAERGIVEITFTIGEPSTVVVYAD